MAAAVERVRCGSLATRPPGGSTSSSRWRRGAAPARDGPRCGDTRDFGKPDENRPRLLRARRTPLFDPCKLCTSTPRARRPIASGAPAGSPTNLHPTTPRSRTPTPPSPTASRTRPTPGAPPWWTTAVHGPTPIFWASQWRGGTGWRLHGPATGSRTSCPPAASTWPCNSASGRAGESRCRSRSPTPSPSWSTCWTTRVPPSWSPTPPSPRPPSSRPPRGRATSPSSRPPPTPRPSTPHHPAPPPPPAHHAAATTPPHPHHITAPPRTPNPPPPPPPPAHPHPPHTTHPHPAPTDPALLIHTSGTTGRPKGVLITHANLAARIATLTAAWGWARSDRILHTLPLHHVHGIENALGCALWSGAACEFGPADAPAHLEPPRLGRDHALHVGPHRVRPPHSRLGRGARTGAATVVAGRRRPSPHGVRLGGASHGDPRALARDHRPHAARALRHDRDRHGALESPGRRAAPGARGPAASRRRGPRRRRRRPARRAGRAG